MADPIAIPEPEGGEHVGDAARYHRVLAELPDLEVIELRFGPEFEGVDPHTHATHTDAFYVLAGEVEFTLGADVVRAGPGGFVAAPPGVVHGFRVVGDAELRMVNVHAPYDGFIERLRRD